MYSVRLWYILFDSVIVCSALFRFNLSKVFSWTIPPDTWMLACHRMTKSENLRKVWTRRHPDKNCMETLRIWNVSRARSAFASTQAQACIIINFIHNMYINVWWVLTIQLHAWDFAIAEAPRPPPLKHVPRRLLYEYISILPCWSLRVVCLMFK